MNARPNHFPAGPNYPLPISHAPYGCTVEDIPADLRTWDGWSPRDCLSLDPKPSAGWYSIPHWMALTEWQLFEGWEASMPKVVSEWVGLPGGVEAGGSAEFDGATQTAALALMKKEGLSPIEWPAPPRMQSELGIPLVLLFPDQILRAVVG